MAKMLRSVWNSFSASRAPTPADGIVERMVMGWMQLSYLNPA
jgi:hypothetical protein